MAKKPGPKFNAERAARILAHAAMVGDKRAADENKVTVRTLQNWRKRLSDDPNFSQLFADKKAAVESDWADSLAGAIRKAIDFLGRAAEEANVGDPDVIRSVAGGLKILTDVATTRRVLDARLAGKVGQARAEARPDVRQDGGAEAARATH